jgi:toxin HigB-1
MIDNVSNLNDLRFPPGNQLEKLRGDREGPFSIRVNAQFRICFRWNNGNASDVELVDYH